MSRVTVTIAPGLWAKVGEGWYRVEPTAEELEFFVDRASAWLLMRKSPPVSVDLASEAAVPSTASWAQESN